MSWKNFFGVAALSALLAGPALAAPSITVTGSEDGTNGTWQVMIAPDAALLGADGSIAAELDFSFDGGAISSATVNDSFWNVLDDNIGNNPFTGGTSEGVVMDGNTLFAALGSELFTSASPMLALTIVTPGTTGTLSWGGQSVAGYTSSRLAQAGQNFDGLTGSVSLDGGEIRDGDTNGDGLIDAVDFGAVGANWDPTGANQPHTREGGDLNGDGLVDAVDFGAVGANWDPTGANGASVSGAAVPEPSTVVLALAAAGVCGLAVRRRK